MSPEELSQLLPDQDHPRVRAIYIDSMAEDGDAVRMRIHGVVDGLSTTTFLSASKGLDPEQLAPMMADALLAQYAQDCAPSSTVQSSDEPSAAGD